MSAYESRVLSQVEAIGRKIGEAELYRDAVVIRRERAAAKLAVASFAGNEEFLDRARWFYAEGVRAGRIEAQRQREERRRELADWAPAHSLHGGARCW